MVGELLLEFLDQQEATEIVLLIVVGDQSDWLVASHPAFVEGRHQRVGIEVGQVDETEVGGGTVCGLQGDEELRAELAKRDRLSRGVPSATLEERVGHGRVIGD